MGFPVVQQPRDSYLLWHPFTFPSNHGPIKAIAVPDSWRDPLTSFYTTLLSAIFLQSWIAFIALFLRRDKSKSKGLLRSIYEENNEFWKIFWSVIGGKEKLGFLKNLCCTLLGQRRDNGEKPHRQKSSGLRNIHWLLGAFAVWLLPLTANPGLVKLFVIGIAAPANPNELYFPRLWDNSIPNVAAQENNFFKKPILRALSIEQLRTPATLGKVRLDQQTLASRNDGQQVLQYDYGYNVTSQDFGMQHFAGLSLVIQGSCYTEYGWIQNNTETYYLWNNPNITVTVTQEDTVVPQARFNTDGSYELGGSQNLASNNTYAIWVSTMGLTSFTPSTDPWYFTEFVSSNSNTNSSTNTSTASSTTGYYRVETQRPVLSCWETSGFTYNGVLIGDPWNFIYNKPELSFPNTTRTLLYGLLWQPAIITTGFNLDTINLQSSEQEIKYSFDANASSTYQDLQRMLVTSYVWTTNILLDTTIHDANTTSLNTTSLVPNYIGNDNKTQIADFVVTSPDVATISLVFAIVVPCLAAVTYGLKLWAEYGLDDNDEENREKHSSRVEEGDRQRAEAEDIKENLKVRAIAD